MKRTRSCSVTLLSLFVFAAGCAEAPMPASPAQPGAQNAAEEKVKADTAPAASEAPAADAPESAVR